MKTKIVLILATLLTGICAMAQSGTISGTVTDGTTGETLIGATVVIKGTTQGAATDFDGNFSIKAVKAGTYIVDVSYISYTTKTIEKVVVIANQTTNLKVSLVSDDKALEAVEIVATRKTGTEMSVITELKKADQIAVGVSAAQIAKTQDRDASAVIRRVPGVSIIDGRFVLIRGLNERYNTVMLNDVITPSLEVDKKAFSFDLIPSSLIDRMLVYKSGGADLPGEFAGGVIKIYTKNIPDENFVSLTLQGGYRQGTTFDKGIVKEGPSSRKFGYDKTSSLPGGFPDQVNFSNTAEATKQIDNNWRYKQANLNPDLRLNLSVGRKFNLGKVSANNLTSISYSNTWENYVQTRNRYGQFDEATQKSSRVFEYQDDYTRNNVGVGIISNFNFILSPKTRIDFRNFFNQNGRSENTYRVADNIAEGSQGRNYAFRFEQRSIYSGQLGGVHNVSDRDELNWNLGYSLTDRSEPDYKRIRTQAIEGSGYQIVVPGGANPFDAGMYYSKLKESSVVANGYWEHKLGELVDGDRSQQKFKVGFYVEQKQRDFQARWMSYTRASPSTFNDSLLGVPVDHVFDESNFGPTGFKLVEGSGPTDKYKIDNTLIAGYASYSLPITSKLNAVAGVRVENNVMQLRTTDVSLNKINKSYPVTAPIPSLNVTYNLNEKQLLRVAYSYSVNRPEFRELAPFSYYDFNNDVTVRGDTNLKTAFIHNVDARWELYPSAGELITFGVFYKKFNNPIERNIEPGTGTNFIYGISNAKSAQNYGVELEVRKSLQQLFDSKALQRFTLLFNASLIKSQIQLDKVLAEQNGLVSNRALQGQSPYLVNAGIYYNDTDHNFQINLLYNVFGKRIYAVGNQDNADQYEMARNVIDLNFTKQVARNFEVRGGISDILNQQYRIIQDSNRDGKLNGTDENILKYSFGRYVSLGLTYKFN
ncbi:MAG: TonB-dependent receptor [Bacteroidota bacterium]